MYNRSISISGLIGLCCLFLLIRCQVLKPPMPAESYGSAIQKPQTSIINLYADVEVSRMERLINNHLDSILYQDTSFTDNDNDNLKLKAWKAGDVKLRFEDNELSWELPSHVAFQKGVKVFGYNLPYLDSWEYSGQLNLRYKTKLFVNRDWSIKTITASDGYVWTKKPAVRIGSLDIPVTLVANLILPSYLKTFSKQIDEISANNFDFRGYAEKGWSMLFNPFKIPGDLNAWLSMVPYSVSILPIQGSAGHIRLVAAITSDVMCLMDNIPPSGKVAALPYIQPLKFPSDSFKINLLTDIPYSTINRIIQQQMGDSIFVFGKRKIRFETFRVYGTNGKIAVEAKVSGSVNGTLYFTGIPYFHPEDTTIRIKELKFDIKTRSLVVRSSKWLLNGIIERAITRSAAIPFNTNIAGIEQQITRLIRHYPIGYGFEINGRLVRLTVSELYLSSESVKANVVFSGHLNLGLSEQIPTDIPR